ncbi:MAG: hypothetical protein AAGB51_08930 [Planctomycetota bacterium]
MKHGELRKALAECTGERDVTFAFHHTDEVASRLVVRNAMLVPEEDDHLVKLTDGQSIFIIDAERVCWARIGLAGTGLT